MPYYGKPKEQEYTEADVAAFAEQCSSARIIKTMAGPSILIGDEVIDIVSSNMAMHVEAITRALRGEGKAD